MSHDQGVATKVARAELMKRILIVVTTFMVAVVLIAVLVISSQIRATQQNGSPILKAIGEQQDDIEIAATAAQSTNDQILDCLDPAGACYKQSQKQQGDAVSSINELSQYAAVCADRPGSQTLDEIRRCIADLITAASPVDQQ